jgi:predicted nucleic acid-binding protein
VTVNFGLELALDQEQAGAARSLLELDENRSVALAIPAFALSEPFGAVQRRTSDRNALLAMLDRQSRDLQRSPRHHEVVRSINESRFVLEGLKQHETDELITALQRVLDVATTIPLAMEDVLKATTFRSLYDIDKIQDALIYAAVVRHLAEEVLPGPHYFVTRDKGDFGHPGIANELAGLGCEIVFRFEEAVLLLRQPLPD